MSLFVIRFKAELEIDADYTKVAKAWAPSPRGTRNDWDKSVTSSDCIEDVDQVPISIVIFQWFA